MGRTERKGLEESQEFSFEHVELKVLMRQPVQNETWAGGHMVLEFELELPFRILSWNSLYSLKLLTIEWHHVVHLRPNVVTMDILDGYAPLQSPSFITDV